MSVSIAPGAASLRTDFKLLIGGELVDGEESLEVINPATGAVFSLLPAENATGNFTKIVQRVPVRVLLDGDAATLGVLRPGLSVTARVDER